MRGSLGCGRSSRRGGGSSTCEDRRGFAADLDPPVTIGERRYIDGGVRSVANADLAAGADPAILLAPLAGLGGLGLDAELASLGDGRTLLVQADAATQQAMGINPLDPEKRRPAAEAGRRQAAEVLEAVKSTWLG